MSPDPDGGDVMMPVEKQMKYYFISKLSKRGDPNMGPAGKLLHQTKHDDTDISVVNINILSKGTHSIY